MTFQISVEPSGRVFSATPDETLLAAGIRQGIGLPYGCKDGACGSCKCKKLEGTVAHGPHQSKALSADEEAAEAAIQPLDVLRVAQRAQHAVEHAHIGLQRAGRRLLGVALPVDLGQAVEEARGQRGVGRVGRAHRHAARMPHLEGHAGRVAVQLRCVQRRAVAVAGARLLARDRGIANQRIDRDTTNALNAADARARSRAVAGDGLRADLAALKSGSRLLIVDVISLADSPALLG